MMREHYTLRHACRSRSVNDCGTAHLIDFSLAFLNLLGMRMFFTEFDKIVEILVFSSVDESKQLFERWRLRPDSLNFVHHGDAFHDTDPSLAVVEDYLIIAFADCRINRHHDTANLGDRHVEDVPFWTVVADNSHLILRLNAEFYQSTAYDVRQLDILVNAVFAPFSVYFAG